MKLLARVVLVSLALMFLVPYVSGVQVHGGWLEALEASLIFNLSLWALECALNVLVLTINISTLGLGGFISGFLKFAATLVSPSVAILGTQLFLPGYLHVGNFFPGALSAGLILGGVIWVSLPQKKREKRDDS